MTTSMTAKVSLLWLTVLFSIGSVASDTATVDLVAEGEQIFAAKCNYCHGSGLQKSGTNMLKKRYKGVLPAALKDRTDLMPAVINAFVRYPTKGMPPFRYTELTEEDLEALIKYLTRNNP